MDRKGEQLSEMQSRSTSVSEPMPVAQLRHDAPPFVVVEKQKTPSSGDNSITKLLVSIPLILLIGFVGFAAGSHFASKRILSQVRPLLREDVSLDIAYGLGVVSPGIADQRATLQDHVNEDDKRPDLSGSASSKSRKDRLKENHETSSTVRGEIRQQRPEPLGLQKSGWGNSFKLVSVSAEEAGMKSDKLLYLWKLTIKNQLKREVIVDIQASLTDKAGTKTIAKRTRRTTLLPLEILELEGDFLIDLEHKGDIGSVEATVRTPF